LAVSSSARKFTEPSFSLSLFLESNNSSCSTASGKLSNFSKPEN
tara:strand:+ start:322 stop:453 length:132 start_codon:yes stop_codon:yes gene_type:complete